MKYEHRHMLAIFDLDGTLFDTRTVNYEAYRCALEAFGYKIDYKYYCDHCNGKHYTDFLPALIPEPPEILSEIHKRKIACYPNYLHTAKPNRHLLNIARLMRPEYYTAVVTTASEENCLQLLRHFDVERIFDLILTKNDVTRVKPDPQGFQLAADHFGINLCDTVIFEDSNTGIQAAKSFGSDFFIAGNYH